jgi:hypothetical protein
MHDSSSCHNASQSWPFGRVNSLVVSATPFAGEPDMTHLLDAPDEVERENLLPDGREIRGA